MKITNVWTTKDPALFANVLGGPISTYALVPLLVVKPEGNWLQGRPDVNALEFSARSLNFEFPGDDKVRAESAYLKALLVQFHLQMKFSVVSEIYINEMTPVQYAAQEERRADGYKAEIVDGIQMLKSTRSWLKHRAIQGIRLHFERAIGISTY